MKILQLKFEKDSNYVSVTTHLKVIVGSQNLAAQYHMIRKQALLKMPDANNYPASTFQLYLSVRHLKLDMSFPQILRFVKRYDKTGNAVWISLQDKSV